MAIAFSSFTNVDVSGTSTTLTLNVPASVSNGDVLVACVICAGGSGATITAPTGWNLIASAVNGTSIAMAAYWRVASSEPASYNWTVSPTEADFSGIMAHYTGTDAVAPINTSAPQVNGSSGNITAPTVTATLNNCWLLCFYADFARAAPIVPGGQNARVTQGGAVGHFGLALGDESTVNNGVPTGTRVATGGTGLNIGISIILAPAGSAVDLGTDFWLPTSDGWNPHTWLKAGRRLFEQQMPPDFTGGFFLTDPFTLAPSTLLLDEQSRNPPPGWRTLRPVMRVPWSGEAPLVQTVAANLQPWIDQQIPLTAQARRTQPMPGDDPLWNIIPGGSALVLNWQGSGQDRPWRGARQYPRIPAPQDFPIEMTTPIIAYVLTVMPWPAYWRPSTARNTLFLDPTPLKNVGAEIDVGGEHINSQQPTRGAGRRYPHDPATDMSWAPQSRAFDYEVPIQALTPPATRPFTPSRDVPPVGPLILFPGGTPEIFVQTWDTFQRPIPARKAPTAPPAAEPGWSAPTVFVEPFIVAQTLAPALRQQRPPQRDQSGYQPFGDVPTEQAEGAWYCVISAPVFVRQPRHVYPSGDLLNLPDPVRDRVWDANVQTPTARTFRPFRPDVPIESQALQFAALTVDVTLGWHTQQPAPVRTNHRPRPDVHAESAQPLADLNYFQAVFTQQPPQPRTNAAFIRISEAFVAPPISASGAVIIVGGPYYAVSGQIYTAGAVAGDVRSE